MTNMPPIASTQIAAGSSGAQTLLGGGTNSGVLAVAGGMANFWDMIVAQFGADTAAETTVMDAAATKQAPAIAADAPEMVIPARSKDHNPLALLQIALSAQTVDDQGNIVLGGEENAAKIQDQIDFTNKIIDHLKNMLPESPDKEGLMNTILSKLQAKSETLQASLSALEGGVISKDTPVEDIPLPLFIALGLNPAEISEVTAKIDDLEKKLGRDITVEDLIAGVGGLLPPPPENAVLAMVSNGAVQKSAQQTPQDILDAIDAAAGPTDDLAAQLNALDVGGEDIPDEQRKMPGLPVANADDTMEGLPPLVKTGDGAATAENAAKKTANTASNAAINASGANNAQGDALLSFAGGASSLSADDALYNQYGITPSSTLSFGSAGQAANLIASPASAGQAHPASQFVAATLTKFAPNAGNNGTQEMTLRLDPPELGNLNIRMSFGKDKTLKTHLVIERPETYLMLQRDGQALERALQSTGFATDGISFELAQDNGTFAGNSGEGSDGNSFGGNGGTQDAAAADEIIQSTVAWQIDPSSGHVRYNIFA